jgi:hypothetical protein
VEQERHSEPQEAPTKGVRPGDDERTHASTNLAAAPNRRSMQMACNERELMKQQVAGDLTYGQVQPPPMTRPPDMAETLRLLDRISRMPDIRFEKVQRMRDLIAQGELETPERIDGTVSRLMEELGL